MADWYCPNCDFKNRDSNKTCTSCGTARPSTQTPVAGDSEWICPKCNHKNSTIYSKCYSCGQSRYGEVSSRSSSEAKVSGKTAFICIAVATVVMIGAAANGIIGHDARSSSNRYSPSTTVKTTTTTPATTKVTTAKITAAKPSSSSKPSAFVKYAADQNNISIDDISEVKSTEDGKYMLMVYVNQSTQLTSKLAVRAMHNDISALIEPLQNCSKLDEITIFMQGYFVDSNGNKSKDTAMRVKFSAKSIDKIDFSSEYWDSSNIPDVSDGYWVHKSLNE
ncbi:MAG: hypothetical protein J5997_09025 [Oscillospiraceae bacterium]|nr:hypothetical protein [Oscillospiraceae bacterium]